MFMMELGHRSYSTALTDPDAEGWQQSIESEKRPPVQYDAFEFLPPGRFRKKPMSSKGKMLIALTLLPR